MAFYSILCIQENGSFEFMPRHQFKLLRSNKIMILEICEVYWSAWRNNEGVRHPRHVMDQVLHIYNGVFRRATGVIKGCHKGGGGSYQVLLVGP